MVAPNLSGISPFLAAIIGRLPEQMIINMLEGNKECARIGDMMGTTPLAHAIRAGVYSHRLILSLLEAYKEGAGKQDPYDLTWPIHNIASQYTSSVA